MKIEVYLNGLLVGSRPIPEVELADNLFHPWKLNVEKRERVIEKYKEEIRRDLRPLLKEGEWVLVICLGSKMNKAGFVWQEEKLKKVG